MAELKTRENKASVGDFLKSVKDAGKRADCKAIGRMMRVATGKPPKMWGASIVGYDAYEYRYASGREGRFMMTGYSPRAQNITIYIMPGFSPFKKLMNKLGKYKTGKSCLYIKRLEDVDQDVLQELITASVAEMRKRYADGSK